MKFGTDTLDNSLTHEKQRQWYILLFFSLEPSGKTHALIMSSNPCPDISNVPQTII